MNSSSLQYRMPIFSGRIGTASLLKDEDKRAREADEFALEVLVRSGDYFVMLASQLDALSKDSANYDVRAQIEAVVSDLIYLQDNYDIVKKEK